MNALYGRSPPTVRFSSSYSATLPFAVGLAYFPVLLYGWFRFARREPWLFAAVIVAPLFGFWIYWGASLSGLLREGLHFWLVLSVVIAYVGHSLLEPSRRRAQIVRVAAATRVVGVLFLLFVPTVATARLVGDSPLVPTDLLSIAAMLLGTAGLAWCGWRWMELPAAVVPSTKSRVAVGRTP